ncbi:MAG: InlB B-repeat-containing protein, partial [Bacteroidales bacterium]|nr:InlB B-repeat-containing protein [Bacteroidales bacterium]
YTEADGKFVFDVTEDTELYCTMTTAAFPSFSGANAFKTTNILVKYVAPTTYTVTVTTFDGGTVAIQGYEGETAQIEEGTQVTVVATPAEGFEFVSWTDADDAWDTDLTFDAEYTFTVTRDINLKAWFSQLPVITTCQVLVEVAPTEDYGTVVIEGVEGLLAEVEVGTEVTAVATPAEGKIFEGWFTFVGDELSTEATYTFTATEDIVVVAWFTDAPVVEPEYCTDFGTSTRNGGGRSLTSVALSDGVNGGTISVNQSSSYGAAIYIDKTDVEISLEAGKEITADVNFAGEWMNSYLFVDWNNDAEFTANLNNFIPAEDSELLSFSFWTGENGSPSTNGVSDSNGYNSLGQSVSGDARSNWDLPVFTIPANIAEGTYRARVKIDWNNANPCGITSTSDAPCVVDFMLTITAPDGIEDADADAVQVYAADGVIYINGYEGDVKVVNVAGQVVKDVNVNGNDKLEMAAGLYMVVTGDQVTKVVVK